jgi:hypothetical protein
LDLFKAEKKYKVSQIIIIIFIVLIMVLFFCSENLLNWAKQLKLSWGKDQIIEVTQKLHFFNSRFSLTIPEERIKTSFKQISAQEYLIGKKSVVEDIIPENVLKEIILKDRIVEPVFSPENPLKMLLVGDSLGNGTYWALSKAAADDPAIDLYSRCQVSSTLSNPFYFDWLSNISEILKKDNYDVAIVVLGANDAQTISENKISYLYNTADWLRIYKQRIISFLDYFKKKNVYVYWLGVPPMRKPGYKDRMEHLNNVKSELIAQQKGVTFFSTKEILGDEKGLFTKFKAIENQQYQIRSNDGIHFTRTGAKLIVNSLMSHLKEEFNFSLGQTAVNEALQETEKIINNDQEFESNIGDGSGSL